MYILHKQKHLYSIDWPIAESQVIMSEKDKQAKTFQEAEYFV